MQAKHILIILRILFFSNMISTEEHRTYIYNSGFSSPVWKSVQVLNTTNIFFCLLYSPFQAQFFVKYTFLAGASDFANSFLCRKKHTSVTFVFPG
jgi:hypothetical protein